jgi:hypothetical protein
MQIKKSFLEGKTSLASNYNECKNRAKKFELKRGKTSLASNFTLFFNENIQSTNKNYLTELQKSQQSSFYTKRG